jgi:hypothetical protein
MNHAKCDDPLFCLVRYYFVFGVIRNDLYARELRNDTALMYTHADGGAGGAVYVWPQRLAANADVVVQATNERHYRRRRDLVWHPHPSYQLTLQVFLRPLLSDLCCPSTNSQLSWHLMCTNPTGRIVLGTAGSGTGRRRPTLRQRTGRRDPAH